MIIRFLKAMWKWAISGFQTVDSELEDKREVICLECEFYMSRQQKCLECGCYMPLKRKIKNQNCPIGKW